MTNENEESPKMVLVNGVGVPTCSELAKILAKFGDKPLFSGNGWWCVYGFGPTEEGVQVAAKLCSPDANGRC